MEFSKQQLDAFKAQHGDVFKYETKDGKVAVFKAADLMTVDACRTISGGSSIQFDKHLAKNCFVAGDIEIIEQDKYLFGLFEWLSVLIVQVDGKLEKL